MSDRLVVILEDVVAGTLTRLDGGSLRFDYDERYQEQSGGTPLSLSMPLEVRSTPTASCRRGSGACCPTTTRCCDDGLASFTFGLLPFSLLGTPVGEDCAGAVQFAQPDGLDRLLARPGAVDWLDEAGVADAAARAARGPTAWLGRTSRVSSASPAPRRRRRCSSTASRWGVPSGTTPTTHILKPAVAGLDDHDVNEHLCLDAARAPG